MGSSRRFCSSSSDECRAGQSGSPCRRGSALVDGPCLTASKLSRSHEDGPAGRCPTSFMSVMGSRAAIRPIRSSSCQRVKTSSSCESLCSRVLTTALYQSHAWSRTSGELASCAFFVQVVQDEYVDRPAGQRSVAADAQQPASGADQFELLGRAQSAAILGGRAFEAGSGENAPVSGCVHEPLNLPVEP